MTWEVKKLGDVCEISTGKSNTIDAVEDGKYAFFDRSKIIKKSSKYLFDCDAIIVAGEGQTFIPKFYSGKFDLHQRAYAIFNFDKEVSIHYVYKYLIYFNKYFERVAVGATAKSLRLRHFQELPIPIPPLPIQKQIVKILEEAFELISKAKENSEQNLKNAKEVFESYLQSVFENKGEGWEEKILGDVCSELFAGGDVPKDNLSKFKTEKYNIPIFSNGEKNKGLYGYTNKCRVVKPSITISARGTIGYSEIRNESFFPVVRLIVATPDIKMITLSFLKYVIEGIDFIKSGTSIPQLTVPMIKKYVCSYPKSIEEQKTIVSKLESLSKQTKKLQSIYTQKLSSLEELKQSILQKDFEGKLTEVSA